MEEVVVVVVGGLNQHTHHTEGVLSVGCQLAVSKSSTAAEQGGETTEIQRVVGSEEG